MGSGEIDAKTKKSLIERAHFLGNQLFNSLPERETKLFERKTRSLNDKESGWGVTAEGNNYRKSKESGWGYEEVTAEGNKYSKSAEYFTKLNKAYGEFEHSEAGGNRRGGKGIDYHFVASIITIIGGISILAGLYLVAGSVFTSVPTEVLASPGSSLIDIGVNGILFLILGLALGYVGIKSFKKK